MGVVGLSFGSPTKGTGFDVSATVNQIVSNLQNVETPWKTKLSSLESQDAAISSLGTLLSTLSTDMSTLTNLTGIMAEKTGSSSDSSVLTLSSANTSSQAGTHTVVVDNLAVSSTGYFTAISNTADILSGSIVLQVGTGTAQTITLDSTNDTLAGLASAINSSGVGITANVLTDSNGSRLSLVSGTSGAGGNISVTSSTTNPLKDSKTDLTYTSSAAGKDATLVVDCITVSSASNTVTNLIPGITFQLLAPSPKESDNSLESVQVIIGNDTSSVESAIYSFIVDYNSLVSAMDTQEGYDSSGVAEPLYGSTTLSLLQQQLVSALNTSNPNGTLTSIASTLNATVTGSIAIKVGTAAAQTVTLDSTDNSLSGLAAAINSASIGVTAAVVTKNNSSTLTLTSNVSGSSGKITVTSSSLTATMDTALSYSNNGYKDAAAATSTTAAITATADSGAFSVGASADVLSGSLVLKVGTGTAQTISVGAGSTLSGMVSSIKSANMGVTAAISADGKTLTLTSDTVGSDGALTITSNLLDTTATSTTALGYNTSSDLLNLASLGITAASSSNGMLTLDVSTLDSAINFDFSSVVGFFQNADSWGTDFASILKDAGTSSTTGMLHLALSSNSTTESQMNAKISNEESYISAERKSLTIELTSANEILTSIPQQLSEINMLYSAITGYNSSS